MEIDDDDQQHPIFNPANDNSSEPGATGEEKTRPLSSIPALVTIVRLLARQAARELHQAANDNCSFNNKRPEE